MSVCSVLYSPCLVCVISVSRVSQLFSFSPVHLLYLVSESSPARRCVVLHSTLFVCFPVCCFPSLVSFLFNRQTPNKDGCFDFTFASVSPALGFLPAFTQPWHFLLFFCYLSSFVESLFPPFLLCSFSLFPFYLFLVFVPAAFIGCKLLCRKKHNVGHM